MHSMFRGGRWAAHFSWLLILMAAAPNAIVNAQEPDFLRSEPGILRTFELVPQTYWDDPDGPVGHELDEGEIFVYRAGEVEPELVAKAGEPVLIPPGQWVWIAQAPGWVSTVTSVLHISPEVQGIEKTSYVPVVPACQVELDGDQRWRQLDRVDFVSLSKASVYPLVPPIDREIWLPRGAFLAYGVNQQAVSGFTPIHHCDEEPVAIGPPEPPAETAQSFMVTTRMPEEVDASERENMALVIEPAALGSEMAPISPDASLWQGERAAYFFLDVPTGEPLRLSATHPELRSRQVQIESLGGSVREVALGRLPSRRSLDVTVSYEPAREHDRAELFLHFCGREIAEEPAPLLASFCEEAGDPVRLQEGPFTYRFENLDDGQYLVSARVDDEDLPGLGRDVGVFLDPETDAPAGPLGPIDLEEIELHGELLVDGEPVAGWVEIAPWKGVTGIPHRQAPTLGNDEYHLYFFARYPRPGEVTLFPESLQGEDAGDLPGLYCCFVMRACVEGGGCRTFNSHSKITGAGRFDIEMPGEETVVVHVVDGETGEAVPEARVLVYPTKAFHYMWGDVVWFQPEGWDPDVLEVGQDGRVVWVPPSTGQHSLNVLATGYKSGRARLEVQGGATTDVVVELEPRHHDTGGQLTFRNGQPVAEVVLVAYDETGKLAPTCNVPTDDRGFVEIPEGCERGYRYLVIHPLASLQFLPSEDLALASRTEVRMRSPGAPRIRFVDDDGEPVPGVLFQLRIGDLVVTPDQFSAGGRSGRPFDLRTNSLGEVVLHGLDLDRGPRPEISAWRPHDTDWVVIQGGGRWQEISVETAR